MYKRYLIGILALLVFALSACTTATETPVATIETASATIAASATIPATATEVPPTATATIEPTATLTPTPEIVLIGPENFPAGVNPLTGLKVPDAKLLERRPVAVKVQIYPRFGRPVFGINKADIVYEFYQNNGISRLHAIFYGQDAEQVGPVRSARLPDGDLVQMYKSIFAYGSADYRVNNRLFSNDYSRYFVVEGGIKACPPTETYPMCREDASNQNNLIASTSALQKYIENFRKLENTRQNLDGMLFSNGAPDDGKTGETLNIRYSLESYHRWEYDAAQGKYVRYQDTKLDDGTGEEYELFIDGETKQPIVADNVIVLVAAHSYFYRTPSTEIVEIGFKGFNKAYAFRDGQYYEISWGRQGNDSVLGLYYADGEPFPLKPGNTWFEVVGQTSEILKPEEGALRIVFAIP